MNSKRNLALLTACSMVLAGTASAELCGVCATNMGAKGSSTTSADQWQGSFDYDRPTGIVSLWVLSPTTGKWEQTGQSGSQAAAAQARKFSGTIEGFRHISLKDKQDREIQHTLVRLNLESGSTVIADLGPRENLSKLKLERGDQIDLRAKAAMVQGQPLLFAERVSHEGSTVNVKRQGGGNENATASTSQAQQKKGQAQQSQQQQQFTGKITDYREVAIKGSEQKHTLVRLETKDGKSKIVNLGPHPLDELGLDREDRVKVQGNMSRINGKPVLMASQIERAQSSSSTAGKGGNASSASSGQSESDATQESSSGTFSRSVVEGGYGVEPRSGSSIEADRSSETATQNQGSQANRSGTQGQQGGFGAESRAQADRSSAVTTQDESSQYGQGNQGQQGQGYRDIHGAKDQQQSRSGGSTDAGTGIDSRDESSF